MTVSLSSQQIAILYPAHIAINRQNEITSIGPSLTKRAPWLRPGEKLFNHFRPTVGGPEDCNFAELAENTGTLGLAARNHSFQLLGAVLSKHDGYLLALHHLTFGDDIDLDVTDFAPGDPQLSNHLLIRVQAALIEESRDVAAELTAERQRVVDVIDRVGRMSGFLAHDLNNFLSVIALNAKRLQRSELPDERQRHRLDVIVQTAERCSEFTQGMMTLANQKSDSRLPFNLDAAMEEAAALFRSACGTKIALRMALNAKGAIVNAALNGLANSIVNLLINSRQAMPAGGTITVSTQTVRSADLDIPRATNGCDFVEISISDEGTGMPPDVLDRAFELFFSTKASGTGVGLASVRDFAEQMDGWVTINSQANVGTTVKIFLPMEEAPAIAPAPTTFELTSLSMRRVLVVDDEDYALEALAEFLEDEDYEVTTALSADDARRLMKENQFDVLVTDVIMHGVDGIDLARWAGEQQPGIPVILMSGFVPDADQLSSDWLFIRKPIDPDLLCQMIQSTKRTAG